MGEVAAHAAAADVDIDRGGHAGCSGAGRTRMLLVDPVADRLHPRPPRLGSAPKRCQATWESDSVMAIAAGEGVDEHLVRQVLRPGCCQRVRFRPVGLAARPRRSRRTQQGEAPWAGSCARHRLPKRSTIAVALDIRRNGPGFRHDPVRHRDRRVGMRAATSTTAGTAPRCIHR